MRDGSFQHTAIGNSLIDEPICRSDVSWGGGGTPCGLIPAGAATRPVLCCCPVVKLPGSLHDIWIDEIVIVLVLVLVSVIVIVTVTEIVPPST